MQQGNYGDELGILEAARRQEEARRPETQDLAIVSRGPAQQGKVLIGSFVKNAIVGRIDVEVIHNSVVVTVHREDKSCFGPVSMVVV